MIWFVSDNDLNGIQKSVVFWTLSSQNLIDVDESNFF